MQAIRLRNNVAISTGNYKGVQRLQHIEQIKNHIFDTYPGRTVHGMVFEGEITQENVEKAFEEHNAFITKIQDFLVEIKHESELVTHLVVCYDLSDEDIAQRREEMLQIAEERKALLEKTIAENDEEIEKVLEQHKRDFRSIVVVASAFILPGMFMSLTGSWFNLQGLEVLAPIYNTLPTLYIGYKLKWVQKLYTFIKGKIK